LKTLPLALALGALGLPLTGCGAAVQVASVDYVWTRTPGVVFVVVHPVKLVAKRYPSQVDGSGKEVDARSEYVLLCDARKSDGMHCDVATEAGTRRFSYTPNTAASAPAIDLPVGSIGDSYRFEEHERMVPAAAPPASSSPPPPPPPPAPGGKK